MSKNTKNRDAINLNVNNINDPNSEILIIKILIVGDPGVGKSNFIYRYIKDKFSVNRLSTVGFESNIKEIEITERKVIVQLWDSAGQEKYKSITKNLFTRVQGIIILYDITNKKSFTNIQNWIKLIKETNDSIPYVLAGNKCDLINKRAVEEEEAIKFSQENNINFMETSAKQDINIISCVNSFVEKIITSDNFIRSISFSLNDSTDIQRKTLNKSEKCC